MLTQNCLGIYLVELQTEQRTTKSEKQDSSESNGIIQRRLMQQAYPPVRNNPKRTMEYIFRQSVHEPIVEDEKDLDIKNKIATLVQQTVHDTARKITSIQNVKKNHKEQAPYKIGFILSMIKKARDVLNELFNVAVKHRDEWKALEQLKIFELIVHTNVDTTNLVRQLVEIHIQHLNTTNGKTGGKKRMVLL